MPELQSFTIDGHQFQAEACAPGGVLVNPKLPRRFDVTPNEERPASQRKWWGRPFLVRETVEELDDYYAGRADEHAGEMRAYWENTGRPDWMQRYPSGVRYTARCLDGGAWDRSTFWGDFPTLEAAVAAIATRCAR